jgi:hypothetical protein
MKRSVLTHKGATINHAYLTIWKSHPQSVGGKFILGGLTVCGH